jgi:hypothetical protein
MFPGHNDVARRASKSQCQRHNNFDMNVANASINARSLELSSNEVIDYSGSVAHYATEVWTDIKMQSKAAGRLRKIASPE